MKSHISGSSTHLWRVIQNGFAPHDPLNLTKRGEVAEQLNATAKHLIQQAMSDTHVAHINNLSTAKEVWDYLTVLFIGNESIRSSKFDELKSEERDFIMRDNVTPDEMYQRILALAMALTGFGCKGNGDDYIKCMFITLINPREPIRSKIICLILDFGSMTSNEVLCEFTALTILKKNAEETRARVLAGKELTIYLSRPRWFTSKKKKKCVKESIGPWRMPSIHSMNIWLSPPMPFGMPTSTSSRGPSSSLLLELIGRVVTLE
jgi:hypothetical protein